MKDIKVCVIGLGGRGKSLLEETILKQGEHVTALCDPWIEKAEAAAESVVNAGGERPAVYTDYMDALKDENVNTVVIASGWSTHIEIAIEAMKHHKITAMEVSGAYSVDECYRLVDAYEKTKTPFMFMENCCYGRRELMALHMAEMGIFGKIVHCAGGYQHDLRGELSKGKRTHHYRLLDYLGRNCENYPTHELGPIARILKINRGNKMLSLTAMSSSAAGLHEYIMQHENDDEQLVNACFAQGDIVTTVIKCANGETITLTLDTTLPRYYSRNFTVRGTKGMYEEVTDSVFLDREEDRKLEGSWRRTNVGNAEKYAEEYEHPLWKEFRKENIEGTHGGMDWLEFKDFFRCIREGRSMPINVYDAASWMVITALTEESIAKGGAPVYIPDFTKGKWQSGMLDGIEI